MEGSKPQGGETEKGRLGKPDHGAGRRGNPKQQRMMDVDPQQVRSLRVEACDVDKDKDGRKAVI
jgi:hypothetical protein